MIAALLIAEIVCAVAGIAFYEIVFWGLQPMPTAWARRYSAVSFSCCSVAAF